MTAHHGSLVRCSGRTVRYDRPMEDVTRTPEAASELAAFDRCMAHVRERASGHVEGIHGPSSLTWEIMREPVALLGAPSAVLLQLAHPAICDGVSRYSNFATDYMGRARRTFTTMYDLIFGSMDLAFKAARGLHAMHVRIRGTVDEPGSPWHGRAYRANEQPLLRWVAVTLPVCVNAIFEQTVRPLSPEERERLYEEQRLGSALVGVLPETMPPTLAAFDAWYAEALLGPDLFVGDKARALLRALEGGRENLGMRALSAAFLPPRLREGYGLAWGRKERAAFSAMMRLLRSANRVTPRALRATVAWHQANERLAEATGRRPATLDRAMGALARHMAIPTGMSR